VQIGSRVARKSYGIYFTEEFDEKKHLQHHKFWSENHQKWYANNQMKWFLKEVSKVANYLNRTTNIFDRETTC